MEKNLAIADKVIMICTDKYVEKANGGTGGVGYEKMIITSNLLCNMDENKIIPIIIQNSTKHLPTFLQTKIYLDFSIKENYEYYFDELIRTIHQSPIFKKPKIGKNPFLELNNDAIQKEYDGIKIVMESIINEYENAFSSFIYYSSLRKTFKGSRILLDILLKQAESKEYIQRYRDGGILLTEEGKIYALNNISNNL